MLNRSTQPRRGRVLINFLANWCGPCLREIARVEPAVWETYKDCGLTVIAISVGDQLSRLSKFEISFPVAADPEREVFNEFATNSIPRNCLIGTDGRVVYQSFR
jgi:peroxiredoxin